MTLFSDALVLKRIVDATDLPHFTFTHSSDCSFCAGPFRSLSSILKYMRFIFYCLSLFFLSSLLVGCFGSDDGTANEIDSS